MTCPICGEDSRPDYRPFCSRRCADIDLGRWLSEAYRLPDATPPDEDEEQPERPPRHDA